MTRVIISDTRPARADGRSYDRSYGGGDSDDDDEKFTVADCNDGMLNLFSFSFGAATVICLYHIDAGRDLGLMN